MFWQCERCRWFRNFQWNLQSADGSHFPDQNLHRPSQRNTHILLQRQDLQLWSLGNCTLFVVLRALLWALDRQIALEFKPSSPKTASHSFFSSYQAAPFFRSPDLHQRRRQQTFSLVTTLLSSNGDLQRPCSRQRRDCYIQRDFQPTDRRVLFDQNLPLSTSRHSDLLLPWSHYSPWSTRNRSPQLLLWSSLWLVVCSYQPLKSASLRFFCLSRFLPPTLSNPIFPPCESFALAEVVLFSWRSLLDPVQGW